MCVTITFEYVHVRPCQEDGSRCGKMEVSPLYCSFNFCRECFMLPDPRVARPLEYQSDESVLEWQVETYRNWNFEAEAQDIRIRAQNLPPLPGHQHNPNFPLSNRIHNQLLPEKSQVLLNEILTRRLMPDFWLRVTRGENPSSAERELLLCLWQVLTVNLALSEVRGCHSLLSWKRMMGYKEPTFYTAEAFDPVAHTFDDEDNENCGLCRKPLGDEGDGEEELEEPSSTCDHIFYLKCLDEWLGVSSDVDYPSDFDYPSDIDCPTCGTIQAPQGPDQISEFLTSLMTPEPLAFPIERPITDQEIKRLNAGVDAAIARVEERREKLTAFMREEKEFVEKYGEKQCLEQRIDFPRAYEEVHVTPVMVNADGEERNVTEADMYFKRLLRRKLILMEIGECAVSDYYIAIIARERVKQELRRRKDGRASTLGSNRLAGATDFGVGPDFNLVMIIRSRSTNEEQYQVAGPEQSLDDPEDSDSGERAMVDNLSI